MQSPWEAEEPLTTPGFPPCTADFRLNQDLTARTLPAAPGGGRTVGRHTGSPSPITQTRAGEGQLLASPLLSQGSPARPRR